MQSSHSTNSRTITIDFDEPNFISLTTSPSSEDSLDPGVIVTASANVTDNTTSINTVIFQYKLNTTDTFTNVTMNFVSSTSLFNASFNASTAGGYNLRFFANDSAGNYNYSSLVNISVFLDNTWTRSPVTLSAISATASQNKSVGIITLNNTGDSSLNFSITSSFVNTTFNESFPLEISSSGVRYINASVIAPSTNSVTNVIMTINATPNGNPSELNTSVSVVVSDDAFLTATITTYPTNVTQGDTVVSFSSRLENVGQLNATNVTFFYLLPADWSITSGTGNISLGDLDVGEIATSNIEVSIATNASTGTQTVTVNSTGNNESGTSLASLGKIQGHSVSVSVNAPAPQLGAGGVGGGAGGGGSVSGAGAGAGGGGGSSSGGAVKKTPIGETIYTTETLEVVRGQTEGIPITITNLYENSIFENINLEVQGFMSQYITIKPMIDYNKKVYVETKNIILTQPQEKISFTITGIGEHIITANEITNTSISLTFSSDPVNLTMEIGDTEELDLNYDNKSDVALELKNITNGTVDLKAQKIGAPDPNKLYFMEDRDYELNIFAPSYLEEENFSLTVKITANIVAVNSELAGFVYKPLTEFRTLLFRIFKISLDEAKVNLGQARKDVQDMINAGFPVTKAQDLLSQAELAFNKTNYQLVKTLAEQINKIRRDAFESDTLIKESLKNIQKAKSKWLKVPETERSLALALKAFEREDFETALQRAKDTQLTYILETKGKINILWFLSKYWWAVILGIIIVLITSFLIYKKLILSMIGQRLKNLAKEEVSIGSLMKEAQFKQMKGSSTSSTENQKIMSQYESRLNKIKHIGAKLRNKRIGIIKTEQELDNIEREEKELIELMKKAQTDYLQKGTLSKAKFLEIYESDKSRLADVEEEKEVLKEKLEKEKISKKYKLLTVVNKVYLMIIGFFENIKQKRKEKKILEQGRNKKQINKDIRKENKSQKSGEVAKRQILYENKKEIKEPKRLSNSELVKLFPGAFTDGEKRDAIAKDKKISKEDINKKHNKTQFKEDYSLSKDNESKRRRKEINKMLREEHGIDVKESDDE